jgi:deoxyribose-phosphate aldolase
MFLKISEAVNEVVVSNGALLKVIFETTISKTSTSSSFAKSAHRMLLRFVKTSSGYGFVKQPNGMYSYQGATDHQLRLMRQHSPSSVQLKAAGGVRSLDDLLRVVRFGVTRIGATATESILEEARRRGYQ